MRLSIGAVTLLALLTSPATSMVVDSYSSFIAGGGASIRPTVLLTLDIGGADHPGFVPVAPLLDDVVVSVADEGKSFDFTSGALFDIASDVLTNGVKDPVEIEFDGGGILAYESIFGPALDFEGRNITQISFILDAIEIETPGRDPNGNGRWTDASLNYTVEIHSEPQAVPEPTSFLTFLSLALVGGIFTYLRKKRQR